MLQSILKLLDTVIALSRERQKNTDDYFERYAEPAYDLCQVVFRDYMKLLTTLRHLIADDEPKKSILQFLEQGRVEFLPARMQLRAILHFYSNHPLRNGSETRMGQFEKGILGILQGGLVHLEETEVTRAAGLYFKGHSLLDVLYAVSLPDDALPKSEILGIVRRQSDALHSAFQDVTLGFEQLRKATIPSVAPKTEKQSRRVISKSRRNV